MEDRKEYSIIGKVEIGTDEYRDLIEACAEANKQKDYYRDKYWAEQAESKKKEEEIKKLTSELDRLQNALKATTSDDRVGDLHDLLNALLGE